MNQTLQGPAPRRNSVAWTLGVASVIGLSVLIGVRVKETLADRKVVAATQESDAKARKAQAVVEVVKPKTANWRPTVLVTGSLAPIQEADIGFKMGGRLARVKADVGNMVKAGQLLAVVEASEASAQAAAASAGVRAAETSLEMVQDSKRRIDELFKTSSISEAEKTTAEQRVKMAEAQLAQAKAQARLAGSQVANASLVAPFSGLITRAPSGIGKIAGPGETLFHIEDTTILKLNATLTEGDARLIEVGTEVVVEGRKGKVTAVLPSLDAMTRRVPMVATIPNEGEKPLLARAFVRATMTTPHDIAVLKLPATARKPGSQDEIVVVRDGMAVIRRITFETAPDGALLVREGLDASDVVVAAPSAEMIDGEKIQVAQ